MAQGGATKFELWRDGYGYTEIKVAAEESNIMKQVKLTDKVFATEVITRCGGSQTVCLQCNGRRSNYNLLRKHT